MTSLRRTGWFVVLALAMAGWMGILGSLRGVAEAGADRLPPLGGRRPRSEDLWKGPVVPENKIVVQKLVDYGVSPDEAKAKVETNECAGPAPAGLSDGPGSGGTDSGIGISSGLRSSSSSLL